MAHERPHAGDVGTLRLLRLQNVDAGHAELGQCSRSAVPDDALVTQNLLELGGSLSRREMRIAAKVSSMRAGDVVDELDL